ncbi:rhodanese-like domain-containing protein [Thioclava sp.]|uniref:rhodanese-like domain-containing protein n=1 Tax=Thioclava sp. TaxID=1933450 RepID=UPI003AA8434D
MERDFDTYLRDFDYDERLAMKISLDELLDLYAKGEVQLIDIRFPEEHAAWSVNIGQHIALNELPDRLNELDHTKTIVTMCPHYDRAEIARLYLTLKGYHARYFTAGMLKLVDYLRGDKARDYMANLAKEH